MANMHELAACSFMNHLYEYVLLIFHTSVASGIALTNKLLVGTLGWSVLLATLVLV